MCGIAGLIATRSGPPADEAVVRAMCRAIAHRGPDETGVWCNARAGLGMTRLSIIDLAGGSQPVFNEDRSVVVVFNGEIYNHEDLRKMLEARGHRFRTRCDTECIVHLYEEHGRACVNFLRGMFAFAVWDMRDDHLFVARDRLGIKPFHYAVEEDRFVFGSEIKSLLAAGIRPRVCDEALVDYMAYGYVPAPRTMFASIHKLPAAHWLDWGNDGLHVERYWDVAYEPDESLGEKQIIDRSMELIEDAVRVRLMSDVPLGAFLSGGIDSSVVVAMMSRIAADRVKTFSIGFEFARYNELDSARAVAEQFGTDHTEYLVRSDVIADAPAIVRQFDEPFADSSAIPTYHVSSTARTRVTVALSGDGGDELFAGYHRFFDRRHVRWASVVPQVVRNALIGPLVRRISNDARGIDYLRDLLGSGDEQYIRRITHGLSTTHNKVFTRKFAGCLTDTDPSGPARAVLATSRSHNAISRRQYLDTRMYLCDDILTKVDRASMMVSLEARVPLLDHYLVEFAATIPPRFHTRGDGMKHILKQVARRLMPEQLVDRPKHGFGVPIGAWIQNEWSTWANDLLLGRRSIQRGIVREEYVRGLLEEHNRNRRDNSAAIWRLMVLEMWFRERIDGETMDETRRGQDPGR